MNLKLYKTKIVSLLGWWLLSSFHPFYLSVTELEIKSSKKTAELAVKCFTNDLEDALRKINNQTVDLLNISQVEKNKKLLEQYFSTRFICRNGNKKITFKLLGFEKEEEAVWSYFESNQKINLSDSLIIENKILYDYIALQTNITHIKACNTQQSFKKNNPELRISAKLNCR
ncbi:MAG: hypothetical protein IT239_02550 [Bacteroidia bacterium]|nr:hypothetical protein [Bacteroidia bacterium]